MTRGNSIEPAGPPPPHYSNAEASEDTPLLTPSLPPLQKPATDAAHQESHPGRPPGHARRHSIASLAGTVRSVHVPHARSPNAVVLLLSLVLLVGSASSGFWAIPATRVAEDIVCRHYYHPSAPTRTPRPWDGDGGGGGLPEELCKADGVQTKVAYLFAVSGMLESVFCLVAAFPWGMFADRYGRRLGLAIAAWGWVLDFLWFIMIAWLWPAVPIEAVLIAPAFLFLGGGQAVLVACIMSILTDVVPESERAIAFMRIHLSSMIGNLLSPMLSAWMMERAGIWPALLMAPLLMFISSIGMLFVQDAAPHAPTAPADGDLPPPAPADHADPGSKARHGAGASLSFLRSPSLVILLSTFLVPWTIPLLQFMAQFASRRFGLRLSETGALSTAFGLANVLATLALLPALSRFLVSARAPRRLRAAGPAARDRALLLAAFTALALGMALLGAAPSVGPFVAGLLVLGLGSVAGSLVRSLMALYVPPDRRTRLFSLAGMVEVAGSLYAYPAVAALFHEGLRLGGVAMGLPYFSVAALCLLWTVLLLFVRLPPAVVEEEGGERPHEE